MHNYLEADLSKAQKEELMQLVIIGSISSLMAKRVGNGIEGTEMLPSDYILSYGMLQLGGKVGRRSLIYPLIDRHKSTVNSGELPDLIFHALKGTETIKEIKRVIRDYNEGVTILGLKPDLQE